MGTPRLMLALFAATGLVVAAIVALALKSWVVLIAVLAVHAIATAAIIAYTFRRAGETYDKPDPVTEARIEEREGTG